MTKSFRPITRSDIPFLKKVYRSTREQELESTGWTEDKKEIFIDFQFNAQHSHYTNSFQGAEFHIIVINKLDAGRLYLWKVDEEIRIIDISLLPSYRNKGIGTRILNELIIESEKTGKKLTLHVEVNNPVQKLYKRHGFTIAENKGAYLFMERIPQTKS